MSWLKVCAVAADTHCVNLRVVAPLPDRTVTDTTAERTCGFVFTTTGRPCANRVRNGALYCRAGHLCPTGAPRKRFATRVDRRPHETRPTRSCATAGHDRGRRAAELLGRALSHDDAESEGVRAAQILADPAVALALLGSPRAAPAARDAVVQRFGLVGALLVVGYEDRWRHRLSALSGDGRGSPVHDEAGRCVEELVRHFRRFDVERLEALLRELDCVEKPTATAPASTARCRLHAAYAVAARDGGDISHQAYMDALDGVLRVTRSSLAS